MLSITLTTILLFIFIIPAIILFVLAVRSGGKKRIIAITIVGTITATVLFIAGKLYYDYNHVIGTFSGGEYDIITIDGVQYKSDYDNDYSSSDTGKILGKVVFSGNKYSQDIDPMYIWSIKGTDEYIYALWVYDGTIFKKAGT